KIAAIYNRQHRRATTPPSPSIRPTKVLHTKTARRRRTAIPAEISPTETSRVLGWVKYPLKWPGYRAFVVDGAEHAGNGDWLPVWRMIFQSSFRFGEVGGAAGLFFAGTQAGTLS